LYSATDFAGFRAGLFVILVVDTVSVRMMMLSEKFEEALVYATRMHAGQTRKKTGIPYIGHILGVTAIALEYGAHETEAISALLHDVVEDCGGAPRLMEIRQRFGDEVARIVEGCTDTDQTPKPPWRERKEDYLKHLNTSDSTTRLVSASDKLHNTRAILADLRRHGEKVFERFSGKKEGTLWYYRALVRAFRQHGDHTDLIDELDRVVREIESLSKSD
jgi:(p)ppGpp synthase/HD superfamily hydrolase